MQSTKNTEWIQMDWKLRIIDKRQEWRSGQSLTFFSFVDLHIVLYCINALYIGLFMWWLCTLYFIYWTLYFVFCIFHTVTLYICAVYIAYFCFFCGEFAHQDWFAAKTLLKFPSCPSQPESKDIFHQNTNKTYFIEIYVQNIWTAIFKILKLTVVFNLTTGQIHGFNGSLGVWWGVGLKSIAN